MTSRLSKCNDGVCPRMVLFHQTKNAKIKLTVFHNDCASAYRVTLSFTNIRGLCLNFVDCGSFFESNSPDILALCETNLDD